MIAASIYYETIVDDTPIQADYISKMEPLCRYDSQVSLKTYLLSKSKTVVFFVLYLMHLEKRDIKAFTDTTDQTEVDYYSNGYGIITETIIEEIKRGMNKYLFGYLNNHESIGDKEFTAAFITDWYDKFELPKEERSI